MARSFLGRPTAFVASMRRRCNDLWRGAKEGGGGLDLTPLRGLQISPAQLLLSLTLNTLGCERVFPLRSKRFAVSALAFLTLRQSYAVLLIETEGQSDLTF